MRSLPKFSLNFILAEYFFFGAKIVQCYTDACEGEHAAAGLRLFDETGSAVGS